MYGHWSKLQIVEAKKRGNPGCSGSRAANSRDVDLRRHTLDITRRPCNVQQRRRLRRDMVNRHD
jgi:hypothetical protein